MQEARMDHRRVTARYRKHRDQQVQPSSGVTVRSRTDHHRVGLGKGVARILEARMDHRRVTARYRKHRDQQVQPSSGVTVRSRTDHHRVGLGVGQGARG